MKTGEKIKVLNANKEEMEVDVLLYFTLETTGDDYLLYTLGEVDQKNMETIHASILKKTKDGYALDTMPEGDWEIVKEIMREIIRSEGE